MKSLYCFHSVEEQCKAVLVVGALASFLESKLVKANGSENASAVAVPAAAAGRHAKDTPAAVEEQQTR